MRKKLSFDTQKSQSFSFFFFTSYQSDTSEENKGITDYWFGFKNMDNQNSTWGRKDAFCQTERVK